MTIKPLADRVVVKALEAEDRTASGIILPDTAKEKPQKGKILAVGPGKALEDGARQAMEVKAGDTVIFAKYAGSEVKIDGEEVTILRESDVLAILH